MRRKEIFIGDDGGEIPSVLDRVAHVEAQLASQNEGDICYRVEELEVELARLLRSSAM